MSHYQKPPELYEGLRLHQNENTGGCSPRVIEALARLRPDQIGFYPAYAAATQAVASYLPVTADQVTLVNGLDEGIMAVAVAFLRAAIGGAPPQAGGSRTPLGDFPLPPPGRRGPAVPG